MLYKKIFFIICLLYIYISCLDSKKGTVSYSISNGIKVDTIGMAILKVKVMDTLKLKFPNGFDSLKRSILPILTSNGDEFFNVITLSNNQKAIIGVKSGSSIVNVDYIVANDTTISLEDAYTIATYTLSSVKRTIQFPLIIYN